MPFVRIFLSPGFDESAARLIADGVHDGVVQAIGVPAEDRFQVVTRHESGDMIWDHTFLDVARSDRGVFVNITLAVGRDDDQKRELYAAIVRNVTTRAVVRPQDVLIVLTETSRANWSFGNGVAHYAPAQAPQ